MSRGKPPRGKPHPATMPIGRNRGVPLSEIPTRDLERTREWCRRVDTEEGTRRWDALVAAIDEELEGRLGLPLGLDAPQRGPRA
jgi:hypothetical protein